MNHDEELGRAQINPWHPMQDPVDLKHMGKLVEELGECSQAAGRCIIQGMDEHEPDSKEINRVWLTKEISDVLANAYLVIAHFDLDRDFINKRMEFKMERLRLWHAGA